MLFNHFQSFSSPSFYTYLMNFSKSKSSSLAAGAATGAAAGLGVLGQNTTAAADDNVRIES